MPKRSAKPNDTAAPAVETPVASDAVAVPVATFTPVELIAIAGAVKPAALTEAKKTLDEGFSGNVDFTVRITGAVQKGKGTPGTSTEVTRVPTVWLRDFPQFLRVLRKLGIGPARLATALSNIENQVEPDPELEHAFEVEEAKRAALLPTKKETVSTPGTAGAVQSQVTASRVAVG